MARISDLVFAFLPGLVSTRARYDSSARPRRDTFDLAAILSLTEDVPGPVREANRALHRLYENYDYRSAGSSIRDDVRSAIYILHPGLASVPTPKLKGMSRISAYFVARGWVAEQKRKFGHELDLAPIMTAKDIDRRRNLAART